MLILAITSSLVWLVFILISTIFFCTAIRWKTVLWVALISILGIGPAAMELFAPHGLIPGAPAGPLLTSPFSIWLSRLVSLGIWYLSLLAIAYGLFVRRSLPIAGFPLWLGGLLFSLGPILSSVGGTDPAFNRNLLFLPALLTTVYLLPDIPLAWFIFKIKQVLLVYFYGSLIVAIIAPTWATELNYQSLIPGFNIRLYGLTEQPNALGPLPVIYLTLDLFMPTKGFWRFINVGSAWLVLFLTQSKTSWAMMIIVLVVIFCYNLWHFHKKSIGYLLSLSLGVIISVGLSLSLILADLGLISFFSSDKAESLYTLTGRTKVWGITLEAWKENPLFGYGPNLWNPEFRSQFFGLQWAGQAHNQFIQSLGEAGLIGLIGLLIYLLFLLTYALRYLQFTRGISLALVILPLIRSVSEVPFRTYRPNPATFAHFVFFTFLLLLSRQTTKVMK